MRKLQFSILSISLLLIAQPLFCQEYGPANGSLVIVGGAMRDRAIVERFLELEVIGQSYVAVYDYNRTLDSSGLFYFLARGDSFDLVTRQAYRPRRDRAPLDRVTETQWPEAN